MAVITQADPYACLIRKIGYSVGLEMLVERVKKLVSLYVNDRSMSLAAFRSLVEEEFSRKKATEHFANFYGTLNLVRIVGLDVQPLYQLETLSILKRLFESAEDKFDIALRLVLTQCIFEADGDIFLNGLLCDFQISEMKVLIEAMVEAKYDRISKVVHNPQMLARLSQIINIKNESKDTKSERDSSPQGRFARRTESLDSSRRIKALSSESKRVVDVPEDYLDKASKTRKSWAQDLGLFGDGVKTDFGGSLLQTLSDLLLSTSAGGPVALFWPYKSELSRLRITPESIAAPSLESWDLLSMIVQAAARIASVPLKTISSSDDVIDFLKRIYDLYRDGNSAQGLIRNSLPLYIAEPVLAAWCVAEGTQLPELGSILDHEYHKKRASRVQKMIIRGTTGALFFMR